MRERSVITKAGRIRDNTQDDRMLQLLASQSGGAWVLASEMVRVSLQYCRLIASLRSKGFEIQNRLEVRNGKRLGFYRLIRPTATPAVIGLSREIRTYNQPAGDISEFDRSAEPKFEPRSLFDLHRSPD